VVHEGAAGFEAVRHADAIGDHDWMIRQAHQTVGIEHLVQRSTRRCFVRRANRRFGIELLPPLAYLWREQRGTALAIEIEV
jgi:hypothetical protein